MLHRIVTEIASDSRRQDAWPYAVIIRYGAAILATGLAILLRWWLAPLLPNAPYIFSYAAVAFSVWAGGLGPGLLSIGISAAGLALLEARASPGGLSTLDLVAIVLVCLVAGSIVWVVHSLRVARRNSEQAARESALLASTLREQATELEQQVEEAQALTEELAQSSTQLEQASTDARKAQTQAEDAMNAMRGSEALKTAILDVALDCVVTMDHQGLVTEFNAAAEKAFGYRREDALGKEMAELIIPPRYREAHRRGLKHYLGTGVGPVLGKRIEINAMRSDGTEFPVELAIIPLPGKDPPVFTGFMEDITVRKRAEEERVRLLESERAARAEAEAANQAKNEFLKTMSHELRTPLNAIGGFAELMEAGIRGEVSEEQKQDLGRIRRNQKHLLSLINDILSFSRIEAGHMQYEIRDVPVHEVLAAVCEMIEPQALSRSIIYKCDSCSSDIIARADREKLEQVLFNLLSNAIKFTASGGHVNVTCEAKDSLVAIRVADTGMGIPEEKLAMVFEPFVQLDQSLTRRAEGTGLGLAISRDLARGMGGDLTAQSKVGEGSVFLVSLRRARESGVGSRESGVGTTSLESS
ncbi:MAG: ATP-binding protein [Gemmatimonadaceae bacterium]